MPKCKNQLWPLILLAALGTANLSGADVIPADRVTVWNPGLNAVGGIPKVTNVFITLDAATYGNGTADATDAIQNAVEAAGAQAKNTGVPQVVFLPAGKFRVTYTIILDQSNVVLRGAGPGQTTIVLDSADTLDVVDLGHEDPNKQGNPSINVVGDALKGAKSVVVADASGIQVGDVLQIDQDDDPAYIMRGTGNEYQRGGVDGAGQPYWPATPGNRYRAVGQQIEVVSKSGNTLNLSTPLHIDFHAAYLPQVFPTADHQNGTRYAGLEDLRVTGGNNGDVAGMNLAYCWIKNVESDGSIANGAVGEIGAHIALDRSFRCEIRECYVHHARWINPGGGGYGIVVRSQSSDCLVEDNIAYMLNKPIVMVSSGGGNVVGYNYADMAIIDYQLTFQESGIDGGHQVFPHFELFEGNWAPNIGGDTTHGNTGWLTFFRNYAPGRNSGPVKNTGTDASQPIGADVTEIQNVEGAGVSGFAVYYNFAGNVLLDPAMPALQGEPPIYENSWDGAGTAVGNELAAAAYRIGEYNDLLIGGPNLRYNGQPEGLDDGRALHTLYRHGNYDNATHSIIWNSGNADHTLPPSLYLASKPAFFGNYTWPWVQPEGTTQVYALPARDRFLGIPPPGTPTPTPIAVNPEIFKGKPMLAYPNPGQDQINFLINLTKPVHAEIRLYNFAGERVARLVQDFSVGGVQKLVWDCRQAAAGIYIARLLVEGKEKQKLKVAIVRRK